MKKRWLSLLPVLCMMLWAAPVTALADAGDIAIDETNFPDKNFREVVKEKDRDKNGSLSREEINNVTIFNCNDKKIQTLKGIGYFTKLQTLRCDNNQLKELDVSKNTSLTALECRNNSLQLVDVSQNPDLYAFDCSHNPINSLDVSHNPKLRYFTCDYNNLTSLDVRNNPALEQVNCMGNKNLDLLDVSNNKKLTSITCNQAKLTSLDVSNNPELLSLNCTENKLKKLNLSNNPKLKTLYCYQNELEELDLTNNPELKVLQCYKNHLTSLALDNTSLISAEIRCENNSYAPMFDSNRQLDLSTLPGKFDPLKASNWDSVASVSGSILTLEHETPVISYDYDCGKGKKQRFHLRPKYEHTYGPWSYDDTYHWKQCTDLNCIDKSGSVKEKTAHVYDNAADTICNDCGYNRGVTGHTHTYGAWTHDASKHWKECTDAACPDKNGSVKDSAAHVYDNDADTDCNICGYVRTVTVPHTHTYDATWKQDASKHWKECTDAACPDKSGSVKDFAAHVYDNDADTDCNICGHVRTVTVPHTHTYDATWKQDASKHWKECTDAACPDKNGSVKDSATHVYDNDADTDCNVCGYKKPSSGGSTSGGSSGGGSSSGGSSGGGSSSGGSSGGHHSSSGGGGGSSRRSGSGSSTTPKTLAGSWKQNQNGWWYQYTNGTWPSNSWVKLPVQGGETWYYFNKDGYMATGWLFENNNWYYLDPQTGTNNGRMMTGWQQIGGQWYYFNQNGSMATGWNYINNNWYFLDHQAGGNNGRMMTGWHMISDKWYYFSTDKLAGEGSMYADRMTPDGFYVNKDGVWVQ